MIFLDFPGFLAKPRQFSRFVLRPVFSPFFGLSIVQLIDCSNFVGPCLDQISQDVAPLLKKPHARITSLRLFGPVECYLDRGLCFLGAPKSSKHWKSTGKWANYELSHELGNHVMRNLLLADPSPASISSNVDSAHPYGHITFACMLSTDL